METSTTCFGSVRQGRAQDKPLSPRQTVRYKEALLMKAETPQLKPETVTGINAGVGIQELQLMNCWKLCEQV